MNRKNVVILVAIAAALRDYLKARGFSAEMVNRDIDK